MYHYLLNFAFWLLSKLGYWVIDRDVAELVNVPFFTREVGCRILVRYD